MNNPLIFGSNDLTRVVSIEQDEHVPVLNIFREIEDGTIVRSNIPSKPWLLTSDVVHKDQVSLLGKQHYKYLAEFNTLADKNKMRSFCYKSRTDHHSVSNLKEAAMLRTGITYFKDMKPGDVSILSFDIETDGLRHHDKSQVYLITNTFRKQGNIIQYTFDLHDYDTQADMLLDWCDFVRDINPSILEAHNAYMFDLPYLKHVADLNNVKLNLGRDGSEIRFNERPSKKRKDGSQSYEYYECFVYGREIIDSFFLAMDYDAATRKFESYALKSLIRELGFEKPGRTIVDASRMKEYYNDPVMWNMVRKYAQEDSEDPIKLYDLMIPAKFYFAQSIPKSFQQINNSATGSQLNAFLIRAYLSNNESIPKATELTEHVEGGISFAVPGLYKHLLKIDLKSCYPSQILRFKLFDANKDPKGYFYDMVHYFTHERFDLKAKYKETKDKYYSDREQASKIFINSAYGLCNTPGLNFNSPRVAAKITSESRKIIDFALDWSTGKKSDYWFKLFRERTGQEEEVENEL